MASHPASLRVQPLPAGLAPARMGSRRVVDVPARARIDPGVSQTTPDEIVSLLHEILDRLDRLDRLAVVEPAHHPSGIRSAAPLTGRQAEILGLVAAGRSTEEIAAELWLSVATVRNHVSRGIRALGARSRTQAIARARELGILP